MKTLIKRRPAAYVQITPGLTRSQREYFREAWLLNWRFDADSVCLQERCVLMSDKARFLAAVPATFYAGWGTTVLILSGAPHRYLSHRSYGTVDRYAWRARLAGRDRLYITGLGCVGTSRVLQSTLSEFASWLTSTQQLLDSWGRTLTGAINYGSDVIEVFNDAIKYYDPVGQVRWRYYHVDDSWTSES